MAISIYTFVKNGIYYDFHVVEMLKHHLPLADEIIVNEGFSDDNTYEKIKNIDSKIKIFRNNWDRSDPQTWSQKFKNTAREYCTGDWCILLDCDEFIPEWEFEKIKQQLKSTTKLIHSLTYLNFYGNYKVLNSYPEKSHWPKVKQTVHRNLDNIEVWGDGSNVRVVGEADLLNTQIYGGSLASVHHFGFVRKASRLREKWREQRKRNFEKQWAFKVPSIFFDLLPHKWNDADFIDDLKLYDGPYISAVKNNPNEFVRDNFELLNALKDKN